jgi:hypothetical protein
MAAVPRERTSRRPRRPAALASIPVDPQQPATTDRSLVASAAMIHLDNLGWDQPRSQAAWQRELWRLLEIVGELKYAAGWVASHFSRAVLKMHDVDDDGELGGETTNEMARKIAASLMGNPLERREVMRMAGFNLWLSGEVYIGALGGVGARGRDQWFAVSTNDLKRSPGGKPYVDLGDGRKYLTAGKDMLLRCWTPHPDRAADCDSHARSVRIVLRELEKLTLYIFAQLDSRLASGGILAVPAGMATDKGDTTANDLMASLVETAAAALKGEGTAAGIVPIVLEVPVDALGKLQHLTLASVLSEQALKLREEAATRLARNLDIPAEELTGMGDTNHWSSYQIGPDAIKKHIEPLLSRMCLALQRGWVEPALEAAGLDPDKYQLWYDTTPLVVRPQRFQEAMDLWKAGLLSGKAVLAAASFYDQDAPEDTEDIKRYLRELVLRDPQMFNQASVRALLGITEEMIPSSVGQPVDATGQDQQLITDSGTPAPPPPRPEETVKRPVTGRPPVSRERQPKGVAASAAVFDPKPLALAVIADAVSLRALELAGGRLLDHKTRGTLRDVPRHEIHTHVPVTGDLDKLLSGWDAMLPTLTATIGVEEEDTRKLTDTLHRYCCSVLSSGQPHDRARMVEYLTIGKVLDSDG